MANRETLKELQARLAQRLQHAQSPGMALTWLAATAGSKNYLFPLRQSGEILSAPQLRPVPRTKAWFLGVVNVRGSLFGTVDLAQFAGQFKFQDDPLAAPSDAPTLHAPSVVTFHAALEVNCALQISALAGLRSAESFSSSAPAPSGAPGYFGQRYVDKEARGWQEINLHALSHSPEFLDISA